MRSFRLLFVPFGVALGLYAEWAALERGPLQEAVSGTEVRLAVADFVVGLVLLGCGLVASIRRRESRTGPLLAVAGIAWFLGTFAASGRSGYADFGALFLTLHRGPLVHALLSYPMGRLERRAERAAVVFAYAVSAIAAAGKAVVIPPKANRLLPRDYDRDLYMARHLIENFFAKLKQFRAIATRYDKTARNFLAAIHLAASAIWLN